MAERDNKGRFVRGNTAGTGRPKRSEEFKVRAREYADEALDKLAEIMRDATAKHSDVIRACELLLERGYGNASCTEPKKCLYCGKTEGTATGHDWESDPWEVYCLNCDADYVTKIKFAPKNLPSVTFNREYFLYNDNYEFNVAIKSISVSDYGLMVDSNNNFTSYPNITVNFEITSSIAEGTVGDIYFDTTIYNSSGTQIATDSYTYYSGTIGEASEYSIFLEALPENDTYYLEFSITY